MKPSCRTAAAPPPAFDGDFKLSPLDDTVALLEAGAKRDGRELAPEEWTFLEAETYARRFTNKLWLRNVHVSRADREEFRSDYYTGALEAIRNGATDRAEIEKMGRRAANRWRKQEKRWRERAVFIDDPDMEKKHFPHVGTKKDADLGRFTSAYDRMIADPLVEMKEALQSGVLEGCIDQLPETRRRVVHALIYGDYDMDRFDRPDEMQLAERLGMNVLEIRKHVEIAVEELRPMIRDAIRNAPSHPDAVFDPRDFR